MTVTATASGASTYPGIVLQVKVLTGAVEAGGASTAGTAVAAATGNITPTSTNSLPVYALAIDTTGSCTAASNNTFWINSAPTNCPLVTAGFYSGTVTSGTPVTCGSTAPTGVEAFWAVYEIKPSGGSTPAVDGSSPAAVNNGSDVTVTTASFTPPAGAVIVAMVGTYNGGTSGDPVSMTVSDTGGGLIWSQKAGSGGSGVDWSEGAFVWTATNAAAAVAGGKTMKVQQAVKRASLW